MTGPPSQQKVQTGVDPLKDLLGDVLARLEALEAQLAGKAAGGVGGAGGGGGSGAPLPSSSGHRAPGLRASFAAKQASFTTRSSVTAAKSAAAGT